MITLNKRIEELRKEKGISAITLNNALKLPKGAIDKFEAGKQTPTKIQIEKIAEYFEVSTMYLKGETNDRFRMSSWMEDAMNEPDPEPVTPMVLKKPKKEKEPKPEGALLDGLLATPQARELMKEIVLETLRSPEGQALIRRALK